MLVALVTTRDDDGFGQGRAPLFLLQVEEVLEDCPSGLSGFEAGKPPPPRP